MSSRFNEEDSVKLAGIELRRVQMPLVAPFRPSFGAGHLRGILRLRAVPGGPDGQSEGWGECVALTDPLYSPESVDASVDVMKRFMIPALLGAENLDGAAVGRGLGALKGD